MYSELKNKIKRRESNWSEVYWEMIEPVIKIRTLLARLKFEAYDAKGAVVAGDKTKELAHPFSLNCKTMVLPFLGRLYHISSNSQSILSKIRFFSTQHPICNSFPEKPTATYYDDLINAAGHERDFDKLHYLLNRRVRDDCHNTSNTFKFITNTATSLSILEDLIQTLARLDNGLPRTSAYNALIARLCRLGRFSESLHIVDIMACEQYGLSTRSFHPILKFLTRKKKMEDAWHVIETMKAVGVSPDLIAFNYLLTAYCYYGNLMHAVKVMKRIEEESLGADARTYDALVLGACRAGKVEGALAVLRRMEDDGVHVLYSTHMHIINTFLKLGYYAQAVRFMMIYGGRDALWATENFGVLASKLIKLERLKEAKLVLEEMEKKSLVMGDKLRECYNSIVKNVK